MTIGESYCLSCKASCKIVVSRFISLTNEMSRRFLPCNCRDSLSYDTLRLPYKSFNRRYIARLITRVRQLLAISVPTSPLRNSMARYS